MGWPVCGSWRGVDIHLVSRNKSKIQCPEKLTDIAGFFLKVTDLYIMALEQEKLFVIFFFT